MTKQEYYIQFQVLQDKMYQLREEMDELTRNYRNNCEHEYERDYTYGMSGYYCKYCDKRK